MRSPFQAKHLSTICLSKICQGDVIDIDISSHYHIQKSMIICLYQVCCLII